MSDGARDLAARSPAAARRLIREGFFDGPTETLAAGHLQAALVLLPKAQALDFAIFCHRNPKTLPLLAMTEAGERSCSHLGVDIDLAHDLPGYRLFEDGVLQAESADIEDSWRPDLVGFLLGTAKGFEGALVEAGLEVRHRSEGQAAPLYQTNVPMAAGGRFSGRQWVSMRPFSAADMIRAVEISARYPLAHGAPLHFGDASAIGIERLHKPDAGLPSRLGEGDLPVFWPSARSAEAALITSRTPFAIVNAPGKCLITDWERERAREG
jgi:uncharacterized protein YcsI (UPF0317 family)